MKTTVKGFTLLELTIVLFLITLILGLSAIFFTGFLPTAKFEATGREVSAIIRHAQSLARLNMESQSVVIDLDNKTYGIEGATSRHIPPGALVKIIDPFSGEITYGKYSIVFNPSGVMSGATIILSQGKRMLRIEMDPITGTALVRDRS